MKAVILNMSRSWFNTPSTKEPITYTETGLKILCNLIKGHTVVTDSETHPKLPKELQYGLCVVLGKSLTQDMEETALFASQKLPDKNIFFLSSKNLWMDALSICTDAFLLQPDTVQGKQTPEEDKGFKFPEEFYEHWTVADFHEHEGLRYVHYKKNSS